MTVTPHPSVTDLLGWFDYAHLPAGLAQVSAQFQHLAQGLVDGDHGAVTGTELTVALRKLLEAKDAAVRATLAAGRDPAQMFTAAAVKPHTVAERHAWDEAQVAAHKLFKGECLIAARDAAAIPQKYGTAAIAGANTKHRLTIANWSDGESIPDGAFLFYTGGSTGAGHVCWKYREKDAEPLVWTNQDVTDPGGPLGGLRWVRLSTMEGWYPNLKRLCIATDCDGVDTAVPAAIPHPTPAT